MEVNWGGKLKFNYTSCGCMLMEVAWVGKLIVNSIVDWGAIILTQMDITSLKLTGEAMIPVPTI